MRKTIVSLLILLLFLTGSFLDLSAKSNLFAMISTNESQFLYFVNNNKKTIMVLEKEGNYIKDINPKTSINEIESISSCSCGGYILIADSLSNKVISVDDGDGSIKHIISVNSPCDVTVSKNKIRYEGIIGNNKSSIFVYSENGNLIREIRKEKKFKEASSILMDIDNYIWINDKLSGEMLKLDIRGNIISKTKDKDLNYSVDIDSDKYGFIYVLTRNKYVLKFDKKGKLVSRVNINTKSYPSSICINPIDSIIWVACEDNSLYKFDSNLNLLIKINNVLTLQQKKVIYLKVGSRILEKVGFETIILDTPPYIDKNSNRTLVPIRAVAEAFGSNVSWDDKNKKVTIRLNSNLISLTIGSRQAKVNGKTVTIDCSPVINNGRTFVPVRFISEALGANVSWFPEDQRILISI